jgi:hypothetical protein
MLKKLSKDSLEKGKKVAIGDILEKHPARKKGLLEAAANTYKEGSLKIGL